MPFTQLSPMGFPGARYSFVAKISIGTVESADASTRLPVNVTVGARKAMTVTASARKVMTVTVGART